MLMADEELHETTVDAQKDEQSTDDTAAVEETTTTDNTPETAGEATDAESTAETAENAEADSENDAETTDETESEDAESKNADDDDDLGIPMDRVEAVLNATVDKDSLTPQMQRMMNRQAENTRRVEETIKGTKSNPRWFVPLFCTLMIIGLVWAVVYYLTSDYPIPNIGAWNLAIAFAIIMVGFIMTMWWR
ncbi:MAG TPA: septation inhibitor protein [Bifidobacterium sp.]|nr:septation inhibitor protein [Bifidobacterium sp.]HCH22628.1 septation inhibitor protein [Bifidobacterium sp.]